MSSERSSSAVRNLRSLFENKASENSSDTRGRSPGLLGNRENTSPSPLPPRTSRIRASFVAVEPRLTMATAAEDSAHPREVSETTASELRRESSKGLRRASFSDNKDGVATGALRETISTEQARRDEDSTVGETIPESAIESAAPTPLIEVDRQLGASKVDKPAGNPDKPVTGAEEEPATIKPADPASEDAVSGGKALAPGAEDLRKPEVKKATKAPARQAANGKPSGITTKDIPKSSSNSLKSPASQPKTPLSPTGTSPKLTASGAKKTSRASLTAPTAASVARAAAADKAAAAAKLPAPKAKPREVTKPVDVSRLTAPTAASRAKHETATAAPAIPKPATIKPKTTTSRPTPRQSLARPESRGSQTQTSRRLAGPVDSSFLDRMTRPTAASSSKTHKVEAKSPKQLPHRPKNNGHPKGPETASKAAVAEHAGNTTAIEDHSEEAVEESLVEDEPVLEVSESATKEATPETAAVIETPVSHTNGHVESTDKLDKSELADKSEKSESADTSEKSASADKSEKSEAAGKPNLAKEAEAADKLKPAKEAEAADKPKPAENSEPAEKSKPAEKLKPAEKSKPAKKSKPEEIFKPAGIATPADAVKPAEPAISGESASSAEPAAAPSSAKSVEDTTSS